MASIHSVGIIVAITLISLADCDNPYCPNGAYGTCSSSDNICTYQGTYCKEDYCCRRKPVGTGTCPPPSGLPSTCDFNPVRNCLEHTECPPDYLCCSEGCGLVCKHYETGEEYPGKILPTLP